MVSARCGSGRPGAASPRSGKSPGLGDDLSPAWRRLGEALQILHHALDGRAERGAHLRQAGYPRVHHDAWLDRILRREADRTMPQGGGRRLRADQAQGRRRSGYRCTPHATDQSGRRIVRPDRGRREPAVGSRRGRSRPSAPSRPGSRTGWRSRPAQMRSSAWPRSAAASLRSRSRPGSTSANRVIFKQLLQAGALDFLNLDACRGRVRLGACIF
jgi:L-fuconate dehydratase